MMDLAMIAVLAASYILFAGFLKWCDSVIRDAGGEHR